MAALGNVYVAESGQFLQWESKGKLFICCRVQLKFPLIVCLKRWNDRGEFELDLAKSKINIAENLFALGHEMHSKHIPVFHNFFIYFLNGM